MRITKAVLLTILIMALASCSQSTKDQTKIDDTENHLLKFENVGGIDFSDIKYLSSETIKDPKLEDAFAKVYNLKRGEDQIQYYYNRIDLNGDQNPETFVFLVGPSVCGSGGCSALIFKDDGGDYELVSRFTLVRNPIIISNERTNGWRNLIMHVSGGGIDDFFAIMKFDGNQYPVNPSIQPKVKSGTKIQGVAIIADDISKNEGIKF